MASLAALLAAYGSGFQPGDTIYVDTGSYNEVRNLVLGPQLSGVTIQGPTGGGTAVFNRGNTNDGQYVFELAGATGVTLDDLGITGGHDGIHASSTAYSTQLTVSNCQVYGNSDDDIFLDTSNDYALLSGNTVYDAPTGINVAGVGNTVSGNAVYATSTGITSDFTNWERCQRHDQRQHGPRQQLGGDRCHRQRPGDRQHCLPADQRRRHRRLGRRGPAERRT